MIYREHAIDIDWPLSSENSNASEHLCQMSRVKLHDSGTVFFTSCF